MGSNNRNLKGERVIISEHAPVHSTPSGTAADGNVPILIYGDLKRGYCHFRRYGDAFQDV